MSQLGRESARLLVNAIYYCSLFYLLMCYAAGIPPRVSAGVCMCAAAIGITLRLIVQVLIERGWL